MANREYTAYQKQIISRYYDNTANIMLQRLSDLVSRLFLTDNDKQKEKLWKQAEIAMKKIGIKDGLVRHIMETKDVEILAKNLQDWLADAIKK